MRTINLASVEAAERSRVLNAQWLVCNGLGGYASGTLSGALTWRYHGMLVAALPAPIGRALMLNHLTECLELPDGRVMPFGGIEASQAQPEPAAHHLVQFRLDHHLPSWRYEIEGVVVEKRVVMPYLQNTVQITYTLLGEREGVRLRIRPSVHFRRFEDPVSTPLSSRYEIRLQGSRFEIDSHEQFPPLRLLLHGNDWKFAYDCGSQHDVYYERDAARGYESRGALWSPGIFDAPLTPKAPLTFVASTEDWHVLTALNPDAVCTTERARRERLLRLAHVDAKAPMAAELVLAADQFIISPIGRIEDAARARAMGDEIRSVIAGYHWFTDWGRDTMISLEGLTMTTRRYHEAAWILRTFAHYVRDGLIPNMFPEGRTSGLYHTADASLWFFHAVHRYVTHTGDEETLHVLLPVLRSIAEHHLRGTHYGIRVDPADDLLAQGEEGYQLTWMDAKVGDWVVTPRRGKAVELNALWYNALRLLSRWLEKTGQTKEAATFAAHAARTRDAFNRRFWNARTQCLFDVVDGEAGDDAAIRPNQVFAIALDHPVLAEERWSAVLQVVEEKLLTPVGLRSLSSEHPDYKPSYTGDLRARDAAYHQGTVWAWLIGPFIDAWLKVHPNDRTGARRFLRGFDQHLDDGCIGSISEVFDAEPPYHERGCVAQAWSVAEVLRCLKLTDGA